MQLDPTFVERCKTRLDVISPGVWDRLGKVPELSEEQSAKVVAEFLELACQCQSVGNISVGRFGLSQIPRDWLVERIEFMAESHLDLDDEWEFRRLLEVYKRTDSHLLKRLIQKGLHHPNDAIREAATEFEQIQA